MATCHDHRSATSAEFVSAALRYWLRVFPCVRREVHHWRRRARVVASPGLRTLAIENLASERTNLEGAAAFSTFVAPAHRHCVLRAQVAFQTAYDYIDSLVETPAGNRINNARQLHTALLVAVSPWACHHNYYEHHDERDDGDYLVTLADTARVSLGNLPSYDAVSRTLRHSASRIVQYQSLIGDPQQLAAWARTKTAPDSLLAWWETAAACGSSMAVFALMASAAQPSVQLGELAAIDHAYFPWIGALHTLLDSLIDRADDLAAERQSLIDYYGSVPTMIQRLALLAREARRMTVALPNGSNHMLILAGMVSSYLSSGKAALPPAQLARAPLGKVIGPLARLALAVFKVRRLFEVRKSDD